MKKFVVVMISFLVLFVFLMLNYLLWDKENLLKQRDTDKIEQDWLRGQNRTLQTTVEELEQDIKALDKLNDEQRDKIVDLEQQVRLALQRENDYLKELQVKDAALRDFKSFMGDELNIVAVQWFTDISKDRIGESFTLLDEGATLWGKIYSKEEYIKFISAIQAISIKEEQKESDIKSLTILEDQGEPYVIKTQIQVEVSIKEEHREAFKDMGNGNNTLEVIFRYDPDTANWGILSVSTLK
jgi:hypothetical protein